MNKIIFLSTLICALSATSASSSPQSTSQERKSASAKAQLSEINPGTAASTAELKIHAAGRRRFNDMLHRRSKALRDILDASGLSADERRAAREKTAAKFIEEEISLEVQLRSELRAHGAVKLGGSR